MHYIVCIILAVLVHTIYQVIIIPESIAIMSIAETNGQSLPRHFLIIIKDLEQEICIILFLIGFYLITYKILQPIIEWSIASIPGNLVYLVLSINILFFCCLFSFKICEISSKSSALLTFLITLFC